MVHFVLKYMANPEILNRVLMPTVIDIIKEERDILPSYDNLKDTNVYSIDNGLLVKIFKNT